MDAARESPRRELADLHDQHVLVVDDNATNRRILEETLKGWRIRTTVVDCGAAAIQAMEHAVEIGIRCG
ncbi:MAG: hypothetical protein U0163_18880 [Gemmatimonadaceae bacterium]